MAYDGPLEYDLIILVPPSIEPTRIKVMASEFVPDDKVFLFNEEALRKARKPQQFSQPGMWGQISNLGYPLDDITDATELDDG